MKAKTLMNRINHLIAALPELEGCSNSLPFFADMTVFSGEERSQVEPLLAFIEPGPGGRHLLDKLTMQQLNTLRHYAELYESRIAL